MGSKKFGIEIKVGIFVTLGISLLMAAILLLGGVESLFVTNIQYEARFSDVKELRAGAKVLVNGLRAGVVETVEYSSKENNIKVTLLIDSDYQPLLTTSAMAEIATQGVLGDKFISIEGGLPEDPQIKEGGRISSASGSDIAQFLDSGEELLVTFKSIARNMDSLIGSMVQDNRDEILARNLSSTAKNLANVTAKVDQQLDGIRLKDMVNSLSSIMAKIDRGKGTLGALVNDPELYNDMRSLMGGANRNRIMRNLVRQTIKEREQEAIDAERDAAQQP